MTIPVTLYVSSTALLNISPGALSYTFTTGGAAQTQTMTLSTTDGSVQNWSLSQVGASGPCSTSNPLPFGYMTATPNGTTSSNANAYVTFSTIGLSPGVYNACLQVYSSGIQTPGPTTQFVPVLVTVTGGTLSASPSSLSFSQVAGGSAPAAQNVAISSTPNSVNFTVVANANGLSWLTVSPTTGTTPGTLTVSVNGSALNPGTYSGTITVSAPGASNSPQTINVTLAVSSAPSISVSPSSLGFSYQITGTAAPSQTFTVSSSGTAVTAAAAVTTGSNWLSVTPASGTTPATFSVSVSTTGLAAGSYNGVIQVTAQGASNSPQSVSVTLTVTAPPAGNLTKIVNAADFIAGPIAPGEIITLGGTNIGPPTSASFTLTSSNTVPTTLGNTQVLFDGLAAPLLYVSSGQVNAIVPYEIAGRVTTSVQVSYNGVLSNALPTNVQPTAPGIFTASSSGTGQGSILNQNNTVNGPSNAAAKGSVVQIFGTGEGQTTPANTTGTVNSTSFAHWTLQTVVSATVGGIPAAVNFAGEAPGLVAGVAQFNVVIPPNAPSGALQILVTLGSGTSQAGATVSVQ